MMYYPYYFDLEEVLSNGLDIASSFSVINLLIIGFSIFVNYLVLEKAGERGWKSLIPFYRDYLEYKLYWNKSLYWINLFMPFIAITLICVGAIFRYEIVVLAVTFVTGVILLLVSIIFDIVLKIKKGKCFGESAVFGIGLILLEVIFCAIIAFDKKCQYVGNVVIIEKDEEKQDNQEQTNDDSQKDGGQN